MAKKKRRELTLEQKEKRLFQDTIVEGAVLLTGCLYFGMSYACFASLHPRNDFSENLNGTLAAIQENIFYFIPINYDISNVIGITFIVFMFLFIQYTFTKVRLHHNVNTLKGKTKWAEFPDILDRYADYEETKGIISGFISRLFKK